MRIQQGPDVLDIAVREQSLRSATGGKQIFLRISIACRGFKAKQDVALSRASFDAFVSDLRALERKRRGTAKLEAHGPHTAVTLRLAAFDSAGHTSLEVHLAHDWHDLRPHKAKLEASFEFDPSTLPCAVEQFEALLAAV